MRSDMPEGQAPVADRQHIQRERQNYFLLGIAAGVGAAIFGCFVLNVVAPLILFSGITLIEGPSGIMGGPFTDEFPREYEHTDVSEELAEKGEGTVDGYLTGDSSTDMSGTGRFGLAIRRKDDIVEEAQIHVNEKTDVRVEGRLASFEELLDESPEGRLTVEFEVSRGEILATEIDVDDSETAPDWVFD